MKSLSKLFKGATALVIALTIAACDGGKGVRVQEVPPALYIPPGPSIVDVAADNGSFETCLLYTSPSPRD